MKKRYVTMIILFFIASVVLFVVADGYYANKASKLETEKQVSKSLKEDVSAREQEKLQNGVLIDKIDNDPNKLAKEAKGQAVKVVEVMKDNEDKADSDKKKIYKSKLKGLVTDNLLSSDDLTSVTVPDNYDIDVSTHRGDSIPILFSSKDRYLVIGYDAYSEKITSVTEYKNT